MSQINKNETLELNKTDLSEYFQYLYENGIKTNKVVCKKCKARLVGVSFLGFEIRFHFLILKHVFRPENST